MHMLSNVSMTYTNITWVWLICALRAQIKLSIFRNIFSRIKKTVIIFSILENFFFKNRN